MKTPTLFRRIIKGIVSGAAILVMAVGCATLPPDIQKKREQTESALASGLLSSFDIPFSSYVELEMWDALDSALAEGRKYRTVQKIPLKHPGLPLPLTNRICFFPDRPGKGKPGKRKTVFCYHPESLRPSALHLPNAYPSFGGGIRCAGNGWLGWTGADGALDLDAAVAFQPETGRKRILTIGEGHYIVSMEMENGLLLMGTCGGILHVWRLQDFAFIGAFHTRPSPFTDWKAFNRLPCLTAVHGDGKIFAAGTETHVYLWKGDRRKPAEKWKRRLPHGFLRFYQNYFIEYQDRRIFLRDLNTGRKIHEATADSPVSDITVSGGAVLPNGIAPVLVVSLKHGKGLRIYDFPDLQLMRSSDFPAESVSVFQNRIYTALDNALLRYDFTSDSSRHYETFINGIRFQDLDLNEKHYHALLKFALRYPDQMDVNVLGHAYLTRHRISLGYRLVSDSVSEISESATKKKSKGDKRGHHLFFEAVSSSEEGVFADIHFQWYRDEKMKHETGETIPLFLPPRGRAVSGDFFAGSSLPKDIRIYPVRIQNADPEYYSGLIQALEGGKDDFSLMEDYLKDDRVRFWHPHLERRMRSVLNEKGG